MKILVPIDGSKASVRAAKKAVEEIGKEGGSIKLLTVIDADLYSNLGNVVMNQGYVQAYNNDLVALYRENSDKLLDEIIDQLDAKELTVEKEITIGEPYVQILETAENEKVDLIIMGNRGFSKIKRFFIGSVTQRVISEAPCPVLVIHAEAED